MSAALFLPYCATTNPENIGRLLRTIRQQRELDWHLHTKLPHKRTLFTDNLAPLPREAALFFEGGMFESHPFIEGHRFSVSMLRNEAVRYGRQLGAEWTMFCGSDTIIDPKPFVPPTSEFAVPNVYYQDHAEETAIESLDKIRNASESLFAKGNSWFILRRDLLHTFLYNEDFAGYGWEDNEFEFRVSGAGYKLKVIDHTIVHSYHTQEERRRDPVVIAYNRALALGIRWLIENGSLDPTHVVPHMQVFEAEHPGWRSQLVLCPARQQLVHMEHRNFARYDWSGDLIRVQWPFYRPDVFRLVEGKLVEIGIFERRRREGMEAGR